MKRILLIAATTALLATPVLAETASNQSQEDMSPTVDVTKAMINGNKIEHVTAQINKPGYIAIHNDGAGTPPNSLGHIALNPGKTEDITITADSDIDPNSNVTLMLHYETNGNQTYDFGPGSTDVDTPVKVGDQVVNIPLK